MKYLKKTNFKERTVINLILLNPHFYFYAFSYLHTITCFHGRKIKKTERAGRGMACDLTLISVNCWLGFLMLHVILAVKKRPLLCLSHVKEAFDVIFLWIIYLSDRMILIIWEIWVSMFSCKALLKAEACVEDFIMCCWILLFQGSCSSPSHQLLISYQTQALSVKESYSRQLPLCLLPRVIACTAETTPRVQSACLCTSERVMWVCLLHRGKVRKEWNTLPEAMIKFTEERLWAALR